MRSKMSAVWIGSAPYKELRCASGLGNVPTSFETFTRLAKALDVRHICLPAMQRPESPSRE
jgi:hypothetical protein